MEEVKVTIFITTWRTSSTWSMDEKNYWMRFRAL
jgi:hypothetical protein